MAPSLAAANMLVQRDAEAAEGAADEERVCFVDWEMVGFGSGPQELGQYLISHAAADPGFGACL